MSVKIIIKKKGGGNTQSNKNSSISDHLKMFWSLKNISVMINQYLPY